MPQVWTVKFCRVILLIRYGQLFCFWLDTCSTNGIYLECQQLVMVHSKCVLTNKLRCKQLLNIRVLMLSLWSVLACWDNSSLSTTVHAHEQSFCKVLFYSDLLYCECHLSLQKSLFCPWGVSVLRKYIISRVRWVWGLNHVGSTGRHRVESSQHVLAWGMKNI